MFVGKRSHARNFILYNYKEYRLHQSTNITGDRICDVGISVNSEIWLYATEALKSFNEVLRRPHLSEKIEIKN